MPNGYNSRRGWGSEGRGSLAGVQENYAADIPVADIVGVAKYNKIYLIKLPGYNLLDPT